VIRIANPYVADYTPSDDVRDFAEERREENRALWIEHYELLYRSHARAASEYAHKALQLKGEEQ
jgi:hypothetical protein